MNPYRQFVDEQLADGATTEDIEAGVRGALLGAIASHFAPGGECVVSLSSIVHVVDKSGRSRRPAYLANADMIDTLCTGIDRATADHMLPLRICKSCSSRLGRAQLSRPEPSRADALARLQSYSRRLGVFGGDQ